MAVTFGCPLVGPYNELCGKHLKVGQRAYATDGQSAKPHKGTNWKTGAVDENNNLIAYENLDWDLNEGGDHETPDLSNYYTKEEIDDKIFTLTFEIKENPEVYGGFEPINLSATYAEVYAAYIERKTIKVIGKFLDRADTLMLDLVGFTNNTFNFSGILSNTSLSLYLNDTNVEVSASDLQLKNNMLTKIEGSENVDSYYPSVKAVADYVAKYGGGDVVIPIISWDEANELLSTGIYRVDNGNATSILISSLLEQQARQVLITGDEFSSRHKTKNIETNEWGDWSAWNYFTTSEDFQNAINFVNEMLANYYTKEETDEKDNDVRLDIQQILNDNYIDNALARATLASKEDAEKLQQDISYLQSDARSLDDRVNYLLEEVGDIEKALEAIEALQNQYIGGELA